MCMMKRRSKDKVNDASTSAESDNAIGRIPHHPIPRRSQRNSRPTTIQHQSSESAPNITSSLAMYNNFVDIMTQYKAKDINIPEAMGRMSNLFKGHTDVSNMFQQFKDQGISKPVPDASVPSHPGHILSMSFLTQTSPAHRSESIVHPIPNKNTPDNNLNGATPPNLRSQQSQTVQYPTSHHLPENLRTSGSQPLSPGGGTQENGICVDSASDGGRYIHAVNSGLNVSDSSTFANKHRFLDEIKKQYPDQPEIMYNKFTVIAEEFRTELCDVQEFIRRVCHLFRERPVLIDWLKVYLPTGFNIAIYSNQDISVACVWMPEDTLPHLSQVVYQIQLNDTLSNSASEAVSLARYDPLPPPQQLSSAAPIVLQLNKFSKNHDDPPLPLYLTSWITETNRGTKSWKLL